MLGGVVVDSPTGRNPSDKEHMMANEDNPQEPNEELDFPQETPVAEMSLEDQVKYWKHYARKHEDRVKSYRDLDIDTLTEKANAFDELDLDDLEQRLSRLSDDEGDDLDDEDDEDPEDDEGDDDEDTSDHALDLDELRRQARIEAMIEQAPTIVSDAFRARAEGLPEAFVEAFVEDLDHSAYLDDEYQVDTEAIQERMDSFREALNIHNGHIHAGYRESFKPSGILAGMDAYRNNR